MALNTHLPGRWQECRASVFNWFLCRALIILPMP